MAKYGYQKIVELSFEDAVVEVKKVLKDQDFGVLSEIDVQKKMKEKLDKDMDEYLILGACNPSFAFKALQLEQEIGLLLPCNVIVYKKGTEVVVSAIIPSVAMAFVDNDALKNIAQDAEEKLKIAIDNL